jgi:hypothetical protein
MTVAYHPLDFAAIAKGDVLTPEQLKTITGTSPGTAKYEFAILSLRKRIMVELRRMGRPVTVACVQGSLRVLTDPEAARYNNAEFNAAFRKCARDFVRLTEVDARKLNDEQRGDLERNILIKGKMLQGARSARTIAIHSHKRSTPGLPAPE